MCRENSGRFLALSALIAMLVVGFGCYTPGGGWYPYTGGAQTIFSYETRPATVSFIDVRNNQEFFRMDIPPGKQFTYDFQVGKGDDPVKSPDLMRWQVWDQGTTTGRLTNSLTVPVAQSRRLDVSFREGIEYRVAPPDRALRIDEMSDRPEWWTPEGGEMPTDNRGIENYDG